MSTFPIVQTSEIIKDGGWPDVIAFNGRNPRKQLKIELMSFIQKSKAKHDSSNTLFIIVWFFLCKQLKMVSLVVPSSHSDWYGIMHHQILQWLWISSLCPSLQQPEHSQLGCQIEPESDTLSLWLFQLKKTPSSSDRHRVIAWWKNQ